MEVNKIQFSTLIFAGIPPELAHMDLGTLRVTFYALSRGTVDVLRAPRPRTCCRMEVNRVQHFSLIFAGIPPELALLDL